MRIAQWIKWSGLALVLAIGGMGESGVVYNESAGLD